LFKHVGDYGFASLRVAADVSRHSCAPDVAPPQLQGLQLTPIPPAAPEVAFVLRRSVVLDRTLIAHFGWLATRSGMLCRGVQDGLETRLTANWAAEVMPSLAAWVQGGPVGARFWPGDSPTVKVQGGEFGAGVEWVLPDSLLEVTALVSGLELVVLTIEGTFRVLLKPKSLGVAQVGFSVLSAKVDSAVVDSPLLLQPTKPSEVGLNAVVAAAMSGIFKQPLVLSKATASSQADGVGVAQDGDGLWLWLDGVTGG
jgi:hypothetical protein